MPVRVITGVAARYAHAGRKESAHQSGMAAAVPAVPGATGKYPAPKKLDQTSASGALPRSPGSRLGLIRTCGEALAAGALSASVLPCGGDGIIGWGGWL